MNQRDKRYDEDALKQEQAAQEETDKLQDQDRDTIEKWAETQLNELQSQENVDKEMRKGFTDMMMYGREEYKVDDAGIHYIPQGNWEPNTPIPIVTVGSDEELELYARESKVYETMAKNLMDKVKGPIAEPADNDAYGAKTGHQGYSEDDADKEWKSGNRKVNLKLCGEAGRKAISEEIKRQYIASTDPIQTPVEQEIAKIEAEIKRLKEEGINSDQTEEEKGVFALYDAIAEKQIIAELEEKLVQLRASTVPNIKVYKKHEDGSIEYIHNELVPKEDWVYKVKLVTQDTYSSLEQILQEMKYLDTQCDLMMPIDTSTMHYMECGFVKKVVDTIMEKLQRTINTGVYIQKDGTC